MYSEPEAINDGSLLEHVWAPGRSVTSTVLHTSQVGVQILPRFDNLVPMNLIRTSGRLRSCGQTYLLGYSHQQLPFCAALR